MLQNYFISAIRSLFKNKQYSIINIGGLALGLAACILIMLFVQDELSYDKWIPDGERIYKVHSTFMPPGRGADASQVTPGPIAAALAKYSEVEVASHFWRTGGTFLIGDKKFRDWLYLADVNIFEIFDLPMVYGNREEALTSNTNMLLSETLAKKYFGDENALGKTIIIDNNISYKVVGVFKDLPENSHVRFNTFVYLDPNRYSTEAWLLEEWGSANMHTYIKFAEGADPKKFEQGLKQFVDDNVSFDFGGWDDQKPSNLLKFNITALHDIHLYLPISSSLRQSGDIVAVVTFSAVALLILVIASINFINLSTARAMKRAREVSLRKVLGATRGQLIGQFLGEAIFTTFLGLMFALMIVELVLPFYSNFLQKDLTLGLFVDVGQTSIIIGLALIVGIIGGGYPAFFLSSFRPSEVLRSNKSSYEGSPVVRNALVVVQFTISIALMVSTAIVYGQTQYAKTTDLGFNKNHKLVIRAHSPDLDRISETLKNELSAIDGVRGFTRTSDTFPQTGSAGISVTLSGDNGNDIFLLEHVSVGANFFNLFEIEPLKGRLFDEGRTTDFYTVDDTGEKENIRATVVNKAVLKTLGIASPEDAIGRVLLVSNSKDQPLHAITIIGVVGDLHTRSLHNEVEPLIYLATKNPRNTRYITLDVQTDNLSDTLAAIDTVWSELAPTIPISRSFIKDRFDSEYKAEDERSAIFATFSLFAIFVACLGLYGLASYAADRRTKEIGLRKVLGANILDIMKLLIKQFSYPVIIAMPIAWVGSYLLMQDWLEAFPYRIDLYQLLGMFPITGLIAISIAWGTVAHRAYKVARTNPIKALRYE